MECGATVVSHFALEKRERDQGGAGAEPKTATKARPGQRCTDIGAQHEQASPS